MKYQENTKTLIKGVLEGKRVIFIEFSYKKLYRSNHNGCMLTAKTLLKYDGLATFHKKGLMISSLLRLREANFTRKVLQFFFTLHHMLARI